MLLTSCVGFPTGITALFIAAKIEEIYPPKLTEFAYVTDGACTENEILEQELVMLKVGILNLLQLFMVLQNGDVTHFCSFRRYDGIFRP